MKLLLGAGASIEAIKKCGYTPLDYAVQHGHIEVVKFLKSEAAKLIDY